jgi:hypothetical protein
MKSRSNNSSLAWLDELLEDLPSLRQAQQPRPYYSQRQVMAAPEPRASLAQVVKRARACVSELDAQHFFARTLGFECVDAMGEVSTNITEEFEWRVGKSSLLHTRDDDWTPDDLYDFVEVYHDLAARPTTGSYHSYGGCGLHPSAFHVASGQALFRWRINAILAASILGTALAEDGEDVGRIVNAPPVGLDDLSSEALANAHETSDAAEVVHAIALFRGRNASREVQRSAILTLARIMEGHRKLLKKHLLSSDEAALFEIANKFDLRHNRPDQKKDYSDEFLEWIFYSYLATVELARKLTVRSEG